MNGKATSVWLTGYVGRCSGAYPVYMKIEKIKTPLDGLSLSQTQST